MTRKTQKFQQVLGPAIPIMHRVSVPVPPNRTRTLFCSNGFMVAQSEAWDIGVGKTQYVAWEDSKTQPKSLRTRRSRCFLRCWCWLCCCGHHQPEARNIQLNDGCRTSRNFARNMVVNTKYTLFLFFPKVLYEQFRFFFNLYFLLVALSQIFPPLQVGLLFTYIAPLVFVLAVTMTKEAYDDLQRYRMDREINLQEYVQLLPDGRTEMRRAQDLRVGHIVRVQTNQRVPADLVLLRTTEPSGMVFLRTDQLDGETDWKVQPVRVRDCEGLLREAQMGTNLNVARVVFFFARVPNLYPRFDLPWGSLRGCRLRRISPPSTPRCTPLHQPKISMILSEYLRCMAILTIRIATPRRRLELRIRFGPTPYSLLGPRGASLCTLGRRHGAG